jgi:DNA transformation protein
MHTPTALDEFAQHMADVFRLFGLISLRRMFSGYGVFRDGIMFGLVYQDTLYLKVDAENIANFRDQGLSQFEYVRQGKIIGLSYYQAPEAVLEDIHEAALWARHSFEAALRADALKVKGIRRHHKHSAET